jgi:voltage-gated potassium channel
VELKIMLRKIKKMTNHYIVCGIGESSLHIIDEFQKSNVKFVLIDIDEEKVKKNQELGFPVIHGNAESEEILKLAGIESALGLIANLDEDSHNLFTVLTSRTLNPEIFIVAKAVKSENVKKLKKVGANRVVSPSIIGGRRMATSLLKTSVVDFLDVVVSGTNDLELQMESLIITSKSELLNKKIKDSGIREKSGVIIVGMKCESNVYVNPDPDMVIKEGIQLIVLGKIEQINKLIELI